MFLVTTSGPPFCFSMFLGYERVWGMMTSGSPFCFSMFSGYEQVWYGYQKRSNAFGALFQYVFGIQVVFGTVLGYQNSRHLESDILFCTSRDRDTAF